MEIAKENTESKLSWARQRRQGAQAVWEGGASHYFSGGSSILTNPSNTTL